MRKANTSLGYLTDVRGRFILSKIELEIIILILLLFLY
jgi:hypothetical protein